VKAIKRLTTDTAIYGMSSIVGRFINWALNPYYTYIFLDQSQMGRISNIYAYVAFFFVFLTFGMETGYFRFASREEDKEKVFSTSFFTVGFLSFFFLILTVLFRSPIASASFIDLAGHEDFIVIMAFTLVFDVLSTMPFAKLRLNNRPYKFAALKLLSIFINVILNIFFLSICPYLQQKFGSPEWMNWYNLDYGIGYVFISNLVSSAVTLVALKSELTFKLKYDSDLLRRMLRYSFPILIVGVTGMINQNIDKILIPIVMDESMNPMQQLGIYTASFKMAVVLNMFVQAFRFAFEPFIFSQKNDENTRFVYAVVMKYFVILGLMIFLGMTTFIDLAKYMISAEYREGIAIVPVVLLGNIFMGIYFNLSLWYKLTDRTMVGAYLGIFGSVISILMNLLLIPVMGYWASALSILVCFALMSLVSYMLGQKHFKIPYDLKRFALYLAISLIFYFIYWNLRTETNPQFGIAFLLNVLFLFIVIKVEKKEFIELFKKK
jgi:O-antigen/teichoic acid export membrane protein